MAKKYRNADSIGHLFRIAALRVADIYTCRGGAHRDLVEKGRGGIIVRFRDLSLERSHCFRSSISYKLKKQATLCIAIKSREMEAISARDLEDDLNLKFYTVLRPSSANHR